MKFCRFCGNPLNENCKFCSKCGADLRDKTETPQKTEPISIPVKAEVPPRVETPITPEPPKVEMPPRVETPVTPEPPKAEKPKKAPKPAKKQKDGSGVSKLLIFITILSILAAIAVTVIFVILPEFSENRIKDEPVDTPVMDGIDEEKPDMSEFSDALENYTLFLNGKLDVNNLSKLIPSHLSDYLGSIYAFSPAEVLEAGYEKTAFVPCRQNLENCKDEDLYLTIEIKDKKECGEDIINALEYRLSQNFRTDVGNISKAYLLNAEFKYSAKETNTSASFALTNYGETVPMYALLFGDIWYLADANGDLLFDEWDIHSYYSEYYMNV